MRLLDQTNFQRFYLLMYGPQPVAEDGTPEHAAAKAALAANPAKALANEAWFPRTQSLPEEVEAPTNFASAFGMLAVEQLDPSGALLVGAILPTQQRDTAAMSQRLRPLWCVWDRAGRLLHALEALDCTWTDAGLVTLAWADDDESGDYVLELRDATTFATSQRTRFAVAANASRERDLWFSAEAFVELRPPNYWGVWLADGNGDASLEVIHVADNKIQRLYTRGDPPATEDTHPYSPVLSPDGRWFAYASWTAEGRNDPVNAVVLVDLHSGAERVQVVTSLDEPNVFPVSSELSLFFDAKGVLHLTHGRWQGAFVPSAEDAAPWKVHRAC